MKIIRTDLTKHIENEFKVWVKSFAESCQKLVNQGDQVGDRGNQQYLSEILGDILNYCKMLPLWSAIMIRYFPSSPSIGSSAPVESNFFNFKYRIFANKNPPIRIDEFTKILVESNDGQAKFSPEKSERD